MNNTNTQNQQEQATIDNNVQKWQKAKERRRFNDNFLRVGERMRIIKKGKRYDIQPPSFIVE